MFEDETLSWMVFLALVAVIYVAPVLHRIRKARKAKKQNSEPSALLGVVYPTQRKDRTK